MRIIKFVFLGTLAVVLVTVSLANTTSVTLNLLPSGVSSLIGLNLSLSVPLFLIIFAAIIVGVLIGFFWEYMREYKHRAAAQRHKRESEKLAKEVDQMKIKKARDQGDEVLALLEN